MTKLQGLNMSAALFVICAASAIAAPAQTFMTLATFDGTNGAEPYYMSLIQGADGDFYGTTLSGGTVGDGNVFKLTPTGTLVTLYSFGGPEGSEPSVGLVQATNGNFYGTTWYGQGGTVFEITPAGKFTTLHIFDFTDGNYPSGSLVQAIDGGLYGTTTLGGEYGGGTVFRITLGGDLTTLYDFCSQANCADGTGPWGALVQAVDGSLYGTTTGGGAYGGGSVFRITLGGELTMLYSFCSQTNCADGSSPNGGLVQNVDGNFYGTTLCGGANNSCTGFGGQGGTVFKITPGGALTTLYSFCSETECADGSRPYTGLVRATDGSFYGTTAYGGKNCDMYNFFCGTVFKVTSKGVLTTLHSFCTQAGCPDGYLTTGGLLQATNGTFYGTTQSGGENSCSCGTVFSLATGLGPFAKTLPGAGKVGQEVGILGTDLAGTTGIAFNNVPAQFSVHSPTLILAQIPAGATTGYVTVSTPTGVLTSNVPFHVIQ